MEQLLERLPEGNQGADQDDPDDGDARQVLGPPVPEGVASIGRAPADEEGEAQWNRRQSVGEVVNRVGEEAGRATAQRDDELNRCGAGEHRQREPDDPEPLVAPFEGRVELDLVRVGVEDRAEPVEPTARRRVGVVVVGGVAGGISAGAGGHPTAAVAGRMRVAGWRLLVVLTVRPDGRIGGWLVRRGLGFDGTDVVVHVLSLRGRFLNPIVLYSSCASSALAAAASASVPAVEEQMVGPVIVPLAAADLAAAAAVIASGPIFQRYGLNREAARQVILRWSERKVVARAGDAVVGVALYRVDGPMPLPAYLHLLAVAEGWRGQGVGRALLEHVEREVFAHGPNLFLCCTADNGAARRFYERAGYRPVGALAELLQSGLDEILYRKTLGPIRGYRPEAG